MLTHNHSQPNILLDETKLSIVHMDIDGNRSHFRSTVKFHLNSEVI
jgi:hypothetical protein